MMKWHYNDLVSWLPLFLLLAGLIALNNHKTVQTYIVSMESIPLTMNFSGRVTPLNIVNVMSPVDGTISNIAIKYGSNVHKGQVLFYINSPQLQTDLRSSITNVLKAKSAFSNATYQHTGNVALFKAGLTSKIDFMNAEDQFISAKLSLWDARENLKKLLEGIEINQEEIEKLSLNDLDKVQALILRLSGDFKIIAPTDGILSSQNKLSANTSSTSKTDEITVGTPIRKGDIVAIIYEMTGLNFKINISEFQFHDISLGQKAFITGAAYPSITLEGYVKSINPEANMDDNQYSVPAYGIRIIVPKLTPEQRKRIQEGMSADITIVKERPAAIHVPLNALIEKPNGYVVKLVNPRNGSIKEVPVTTGDTNETSIEIKSGLQEGDTIVLPD